MRAVILTLSLIAHTAIAGTIIVDDMMLETAALQNRWASTGFGIYRSKPWPGSTIPYELDPDITESQLAMFLKAAETWGSEVNLRFIPRTTEANYLLVTNDDPERCFASVGAGREGGRRVFNMGNGRCWNERTVTHELGHSLGFMHEHQRPDRDAYIKVRLENVHERYQHNFDILSTDQSDSQTAYDFLSIMHYGEWAGSNEKGPAFEIVEEHKAITEAFRTKSGLSAGDKELVRRVYGELPAPQEAP